MGVRAGKWPKERLEGLTGFFTKVGYKRTGEWKEEIIIFDPDKDQKDAPKPVFPDGTAVELTRDQDPRKVFADWLIRPENPWFARNIVNRTWFWLLGRGIIHEPDDLRSTNPPTNPELLEYLEQELVSHNYDLKHIYRLILNSRTYQLSSKAIEGNESDSAFFSHYYVKRLGAETLLDAIGQVTTLSYEHPTDPLKITKVTDPFGRFATLEYDASLRLVKITDVIGLTSACTLNVLQA